MLKCITPHNAHCIISTIIHQISTIFKTIDDETTISGQRIVSVLQARKIAQQQATTQLETDIACLKQYEIACQSGSVSTEQFDSIMKKASVSATEYSSKIKEGTGSAQSYASAQKANNAALQSVGTGAGIASKAVKALSATMNTIAITAIFTLISKGISWVSEQIDDYIHRNEIAIEKAEELLDTFETEVNTITSNQDKISGYADEFEELSKGVDNLGRNVSLTASKYSKYQSIVKEIVGINPSLIQGYDEENNILANKNGLIETSIQLLKDEYNQKLKNLALPDNIDTALGGAVGRYNTAKEDFLEVEIPATLAWSGVKIDEDGNRETGYVNQISQYIEDVIGVEFTGWEGGINQYILDNAEAVFDNLDKIKERAAETKDGWEGLNDSQLIDLMDYFKELRIAYNDMNTASTSANPTLQYVAMVEDAYSQLSDTQKQMVSEYINGIKITSETTEQEKENIRKSIISLVQDLSDIDNTDVQNAITSLYAPQDEEETVETYKARIEAAIQTIKNYCEENGIEIPIDFDSKTSSVDKMVNNVKNKLKGTEFDDKELNLGSLTLDELEIATTISTEEFTKAIEEEKKKYEKLKAEFENTGLQDVVDDYDDAVKSSKEYVNSLDDIYKSYNGINNIDRDILYWNDETLENNRQFLEEMYGSYEDAVADLKGTWSTVLGTSENIDGVEIAYTQMLQTDHGLVPLTEDTFWSYFDSIFSQSWNEDGTFNAEKFIQLDAQGTDMLINGQMEHVANMIAAAEGQYMNGIKLTADDVIAIGTPGYDDDGNDILPGNNSPFKGYSVHDVQAWSLQADYQLARVEEKAKETGNTVEGIWAKKDAIDDYADYGDIALQGLIKSKQQLEKDNETTISVCNLCNILYALKKALKRLKYNRQYEFENNMHMIVCV